MDRVNLAQAILLELIASPTYKNETIDQYAKDAVELTDALLTKLAEGQTTLLPALPPGTTRIILE